MLRSPIFSLLLLLCSIAAAPAHAATSLLQAIKAHEVSMTAIKNTGSYHGKGLDLQLKNNTNKTIRVSVDPAMIFGPADTEYQDLVIIHDEVIVLKPNEEQTIPVQSFCAKSYAGSPRAHLSYKFRKQGDAVMIQLLRYIVNNNVDGSLAQNAVWVLTNHHYLGNIYSGNNDPEALKLTMYLAGLLHKPMPDFFTYHKLNETPGEVAYNPKPLKMMAKFEYIAETDQVLTLGVYTANGTTIESVFDNKPFGKGGHRFTVEFEAADVPAGKYYIRLLREGQVIKEQVVKVE